MSWMNEYDIEDALCMFTQHGTSNLGLGATVLARLMGWTNTHSDGWPYWKKPSRAAAKLMDLIEDARRRARTGDYADATDAQLKAALSPIKAFLTRHGADPEDKAAIFEGIS